MVAFNVAQLKIAGNNFSVTVPWADDKGVTDSYSNTLNAISAVLQPHPLAYMWTGGKFGDVKFKIRMCAGDKNTEGIETTQKLQTVVENLFKISLIPYKQTSNTAGSIVGSGQFKLTGKGTVAVSIGQAWVRSGYIKDISVNRELPMDSQGYPYVVTVEFTFVMKFSTQMPSPTNFTFRNF